MHSQFKMHHSQQFAATSKWVVLFDLGYSFFSISQNVLTFQSICKSVTYKHQIYVIQSKCYQKQKSCLKNNNWIHLKNNYSCSYTFTGALCLGCYQGTIKLSTKVFTNKMTVPVHVPPFSLSIIPYYWDTWDPFKTFGLWPASWESLLYGIWYC